MFFSFLCCIFPLYDVFPVFRPVLKYPSGGTCVAQSVEQPSSAQVMFSRFVSSSPTLGSVLTAWNLEPASESVSPSLSAPPSLAPGLSLSLSLSLSNINKHYIFFNPER